MIRIHIDYISELFHNIGESFGICTHRKCFIYRLTHQIVTSRLAVLFCKVQLAWRLSFRIFNDRQTVFFAKLIGNTAQFPVCTLVAVKLLTVPHIHRIDDQMIVICAGVKVRSDQHLVLIAPHSFGKFNAEFVGKLRCNFACLKTLICVISHITDRLVKAFLYRIHLGKSRFCGAVYACNIHGFFFTDYGFSLVACVVKCLANIAVNRLVRVCRIAQNTVDAVCYSPYFCYCHGESLALSGSPIVW